MERKTRHRWHKNGGGRHPDRVVQFHMKKEFRASSWKALYFHVQACTPNLAVLTREAEDVALGDRDSLFYENDRLAMKISSMEGIGGSYENRVIWETSKIARLTWEVETCIWTTGIHRVFRDQQHAEMCNPCWHPPACRNCRILMSFLHFVLNIHPLHCSSPG